MASTATTWSDDFSRPDGDIGNGWQYDGALAIARQAVKQGSSASSVATLSRSTSSLGIGPDYRVSATIACDDDSSDRVGSIILRRDGNGDHYKVSLKWSSSSGAEKLTLSVSKVVNSVETELDTLDVTAFADKSNGSYDDVFQRVAGEVFDEDGAAVIQAYFSDGEREILRYEDRSYPILTEAGEFGVEFNDSDVVGHVILDWVAIEALSDFAVGYEVVDGYWTLGKIRDSVRVRAFRDSRLQGLDAELLNDLINEANHELHALLGFKAPWLRRRLDVTIGANEDSIPLPPDVAVVGSEAWSGNLVVPVVSERDHIADGVPVASGGIRRFVLSGAGPDGGLRLIPWPVPTTSSDWTFDVFRRPRFLTADTDVPELPQDLCPALVWGAVLAYSGRDSDRTHLAFAAQKWASWVAQARARARVIRNSGNSVASRFSRRGTAREGIWGVRDLRRF